MVERGTRQHGLTLIEVLASLVLLALITTATLPLLREAGHCRDGPADVAMFDELSLLADQIIAEPQAFGLASMSSTAACAATLAWPEHGAREPIQIRTDAGDPQLEKQQGQPRLVLFECGAVAVARWWPREVPPSEPPPPEHP